MASFCIICASPCQKDEGDSTGDQLRVIFILRNVLGISDSKLNELVGGKVKGQLQLCGPCGEEVKGGLEAVKETAKLRNKITRISAALKDRIIESSDEVGEGSNSVWGQIRLDFLLTGAFEDGSALNSNHNQPLVSFRNDYGFDDNRSLTDFGMNEAGGGHQETVLDKASIEDLFGGGGDPLSVVDFNGAYLDIQHGNKDAGGDRVDAVFGGDPLGKVGTVEKSFFPSRPSSSEEIVKTNQESPKPNPKSSSKRSSSRTTESGSLMDFETSSEQDSGGDRKRKRRPTVKSKRESNSQKYVCRVCSRSYSSSKNFKSHIEDKICQRPRVKKEPCKYCANEYVDRKEHEKSCKKNDEFWKTFLK